MPVTNCRWFNGYKPCKKNSICDASCPLKEDLKQHILVVHLEALGAVLRSTSLLKALKKKHPHSKLTWITKAPADQLLKLNPLIDQVLCVGIELPYILSSLHFDVVYNIDKGVLAAGIAESANPLQIYGFRCNRFGAVIPATPQDEELWNLGLDDEKMIQSIVCF